MIVRVNMKLKVYLLEVDKHFLLVCGSCTRLPKYNLVVPKYNL